MSRYELWGLFGPSTWVGWGAVLTALAFAFGRPVLARRAALLTAAIAVATMALPLGFWLMEPLESRFAPRPIGWVVADEIVVLAGGEKLAPSLRRAQPQFTRHGERVLLGAMLAQTLPRARLWAVGGVRLKRGGPADVEWDWIVWRGLGIAPARIGLIADTADTCQNAKGLKRRVGPARRIVLVTSAFHMPRAVACFRAAGLDPLPFPVDYQNGPPTAAEQFRPAALENLARVDLALHEYAGLVWYRLAGRTRELWPAATAS